jgi:protoheme ferro-lyase
MPAVTEPCERDKSSASDELTACHGAAQRSHTVATAIPIYYTNRQFITLFAESITDPYTQPN